MSSLSISDIKTSILVPQLIKDEFISSGDFMLRPNGEPMMYTGGFTSVFPCSVNGEKWAFRCWHKDLGNVRQRFQKLDEALKAVKISYLADFKYVDEGIIVNGKIYPTTRMRWIDGINIKDYVYNNRHKKDILLKLADDFLTMCKTLHSHHFAHGDLQHGNIIVQDDGSLYLIDYDSLYHPSMGDLTDIITGLKDYQHPSRKNYGRASEKLDYFSELIIYLCIIAVSENPALANTYKLKEKDSMLFTAEDYKDITQSVLFNQLTAKDDYVKILCNILEEYLSHNDIDELYPIESMLELMIGEPVISSLSFNDNGNGIYENENITITWSIDNPVVKQELNGQEISSNERSYSFIAQKGTLNLTLTVSNYLHSTSKSISIDVHPLVEIGIKSDKSVLKKGKTNRISLKWSVKNASSVTITDSAGNKLSSSMEDDLALDRFDSECFIISAIGLDGKREFRKELRIDSANESIVDFNVDKHFTLPGVPVRVSWDIKHAKTVKIKGKGKVEHSGSFVLEPEKDTSIILTVEDKFGKHKYEEKIRMLPLPVVKLKPPEPNITHQAHINASFVRPNVKVITPRVSTIRAVPFVPQLKIPGVKAVLHLITPNFVGLKISHHGKGFSTWNVLTNLSNKLFLNLKKSISQNENE